MKQENKIKFAKLLKSKTPFLDITVNQDNITMSKNNKNVYVVYINETKELMLNDKILYKINKYLMTDMRDYAKIVGIPTKHYVSGKMKNILKKDLYNHIKTYAQDNTEVSLLLT